MSYQLRLPATSYQLVKGIAEAEHHLIHIAECCAGLKRAIDELVVHDRKPVARAALCIGDRVSQQLHTIRCRRRYHQSLADAPVRIHQVPEIRDIETELAGVPLTADVDRKSVV